MKINSLSFLVLSFLVICICNQGDAAFTLKDGSLVDANQAATLPMEEHYRLGSLAIERSNWKEAAKQFLIVSSNFPNSSYGHDANYYLGIAYYHLEELDFANDAFTQYLRSQSNPQFFEDTIGYKFEIANRFKAGAKRRFFGTKQLPKWASGHSLAIEIYDEVIAAVPCHELAAWSLYFKADMLSQDGAYRESIDVYQLLIRRFPKHELAPESYLAISRIYIQQSLCELQNPDLLAFAHINLRRFKQDFPREPRISQVEKDVLELKEIYARSLFETGQFYERKKHPSASVIYYQNCIEQFPDTSTAQMCQRRLSALNKHVNFPRKSNQSSAS